MERCAGVSLAQDGDHRAKRSSLSPDQEQATTEGFGAPYAVEQCNLEGIGIHDSHVTSDVN